MLPLKTKKLNNGGFSLVELLTAMAILGIVGVAIYTYMTSGARLYNKTKSDADIQTEAQLVANSICDLVIDCEVNVSYGDVVKNRIPSGAAVSNNAVDANHILEIDNTDKQFLIIPDGHNLFYLEREADKKGNYEAYDVSNAQLLAQNVAEFIVDLSRITGKRGKNLLTFQLTYEKGGRKYVGDYQVNLRNAVTVNSVVNKADSKDEDLTKIRVTPAEIYVDVKGKATPKTVPSPRTQTFTAYSDAKNVKTDDLYTWSLDPSTGICAAGSAGASKREYNLLFNTVMTHDIPASFEVVCTSKIKNATTGNYAEGKAVVYYRKINDMSVSPERGIVTQNGFGVAEPGTTVTVKANFDGYNLEANHRKCTWTLYRKDFASNTYVPCEAKYATLQVPGGKNEMAYISLKKDCPSTTNFKVKAVSDWDKDYEAEFPFGTANTPPDAGGPNTAARGLEISVTDVYQKEKWDLPAKDSYGCELVKINALKWQATPNDDFASTTEFGYNENGAYIYIDYGASRYQDIDRVFNLVNVQYVQMIIYYMCDRKCGNAAKTMNYAGQTVEYTHECNQHFYFDPVKIIPKEPAANTILILKKKNGISDISFKTTGWNLNKKTQIGLYFYDEATKKYRNVNSREVGYDDFNNYLTMKYMTFPSDGQQASRKQYVKDGTIRLYTKDTKDYPASAIMVRVTLDYLYQLANVYQPGNKYLDDSYYDLEAYIDNFEDENIPYFVSYPVQNVLDANKVDVTVVSDNGNGTGTKLSNRTFGLDEDFKVNSKTFRISAVRNNNAVSYYTLSIDNKMYYYNTTYHYWKAFN